MRRASNTISNTFCQPYGSSHRSSYTALLDSNHTSSLSPLPKPYDVEIWCRTHLPDAASSNMELVPFSALKLQGRLLLREFRRVETWMRLLKFVQCSRFPHVDLRNVPSNQLSR